MSRELAAGGICCSDQARPVLLPQRKGNITFRRRNTENLIMPEIEMHKIPRTQGRGLHGLARWMRQDFNLSSTTRATELSTCPVCTRTVGEEDGEGVDVGDERLNAPPALARRRRDLRVGGIFRRKNKSLSHDTNGTHCMPAFCPQHTILARPECDHVRSRGCVNSKLNLSGT